MNTISEFLMVGLGGAFGAASRHSIARLAKDYATWINFPIGTLIANLIGCFLIGLLIGSGRGIKDKRLSLVFGAGFLGALTTFSTFGAETVGQVSDGQWVFGLLNIVSNLVLGLAAVVTGIWLGRKWLS